MSIGQNIKMRRQDLNLTLEEVAKKVGVSRQTLSRYETGVIGNIPSDKIEALAKALQTTPATLMGWDIKDKIGADNNKKTSPLPSENELDAELISRLMQLTPEEEKQADAFVQGLLASRSE